MGLPVLNAKTFEVKQPSTGDKIRLRPFLVAEEKILLQVADGSPKEMSDATKQILKQCVQDKPDFDPDKLPSFDIEYLFLRLRAESVGAKVVLNLPHKEDCERTEFTIDLTHVKVEFDEKHSNEIMLDKKVGVIMTYPSVDILSEIAELEDETAQSFGIMSKCIGQVFTADGEMHSFSDASDKEKDDFINSMSTEQFMKLQDFFGTMPTLKYIAKVKQCVTCGQPFEYEITGLANFF